GRVAAGAARVEVDRAVEEEVRAVGGIVEGQCGRQARGETGHRRVAQELHPLRLGAALIAVQMDDELVAFEAIPGAPGDALARFPVVALSRGRLVEEIVAVPAPVPRVVLLLLVALGARVEWQLGAELHGAVPATFRPENGSGRRLAAAAIRPQERPAARD